MGKGERETIASQIWETIDLFNEPVRLTMRGKRVLSTNLGGILTICLVCFILYQAISQFVGMINREDPMIVEMSEIDESTTKMRLSHENNFFIAYTIHRNLSFVDFNVDAPFRYKSTFVRKTQLEDGSRIKEEYPVVWGPCKESDFPPDIFGDQFTTLSFSYAHCFVGVNFTSSVDGSCPEEYASYPSCISTDFTIQGAYGESLEEYIQSTLVVCDPNDPDRLHQ